MTQPKQQHRNEQPHGQRDRDSAHDRPQKRHDYVAGADGDQDVDASQADNHETKKPDTDGTGW